MILACGNMDLNPCLHHNMTTLMLIEGIGAAEGVDWRAGPVKGATMGFKFFSLNSPKTMIRLEGCL